MLTTRYVLLCVCVSWIPASVAKKNSETYSYQELGYNEGDVCKEEAGALWTCKKFMECPQAKQAFEFNKTRPIVCSLKTKTLNGFIVCCDTGDKPRATKSKSTEMCEEYAKSVIVKKQGGGFFDDPDEVEDTCAATEPLIAFGVEAEPKEFPHMALVGVVGKRKEIYWVCGGSLISERFVLSAAHCSSVSPTSKLRAQWVRLGEYNVQSTQDEMEGKAFPQNIKIAETIFHPGWEPPSLYDDLVLFKLETEVTFNQFVRPACLQSSHYFPKTYALATGWGKIEDSEFQSPVLMKVNLTLFDREGCSSSYSDAIGSLRLREGIKDQRQICAGDTVTKKDVCQGDSGGPLQIRLKKPYCMYSVIGVVSLGPKECGEGGAPSVFSRVSHYLPWIESQVWP